MNTGRNRYVSYLFQSFNDNYRKTIRFHHVTDIQVGNRMNFRIVGANHESFYLIQISKAKQTSDSPHIIRTSVRHSFLKRKIIIEWAGSPFIECGV